MIHVLYVIGMVALLVVDQSLGSHHDIMLAAMVHGVHVLEVTQACGCCCLLTNTINAFILDESYYFNKDGRLFTTKVMTVQMGDGDYGIGPALPSEQIKLGTNILWPQFDFGKQLGVVSIMENVIMRIEHYNVTKTNNKCCASIKIGFSCEIKGCCGDGCCC